MWAVSVTHRCVARLGVCLPLLVPRKCCCQRVTSSAIECGWESRKEKQKGAGSVKPRTLMSKCHGLFSFQDSQHLQKFHPFSFNQQLFNQDPLRCTFLSLDSIVLNAQGLYHGWLWPESHVHCRKNAIWLGEVCVCVGGNWQISCISRHCKGKSLGCGVKPAGCVMINSYLTSLGLIEKRI